MIRKKTPTFQNYFRMVPLLPLNVVKALYCSLRAVAKFPLNIKRIEPWCIGPLGFTKEMWGDLTL